MKKVVTKEYIPFGSEWVAEMSKLPRATLIVMLRKALMGLKQVAPASNK